MSRERNLELLSVVSSRGGAAVSVEVGAEAAQLLVDAPGNGGTVSLVASLSRTRGASTFLNQLAGKPLFTVGTATAADTHVTRGVRVALPGWSFSGTTVAFADTQVWGDEIGRYDALLASPCLLRA